ncbi:MAG: hypothetical protein AB1640_14015 [bacterium]
MSLESANAKFGALLARQIERRSVWLKILLLVLAAMVLANVFAIRPGHETAPPASHGAEAQHAAVVAGHGGEEPHVAAGGEGASATGHEAAVPAASEGEAALHSAGAPHGAAAEGEHGHAAAASAPEEMRQIEGVRLNYYPEGSHAYNLVRWASENAAGRAALTAFHYIHAAEEIPAFWALFGVFCTWLLVRLSKGSAHTFLGKSEDFYDR